MKVTKLLPRKLAIGWQEYDLARTDDKLDYHRAIVNALEEMSNEGHAELRRLKGGND